MTPQIEMAIRVLINIVLFAFPNVDSEQLKYSLRSLLKSFTYPNLVTIKSIKQNVADTYKITEEAIDSESRNREYVVVPRQIAHTIAYFALCKQRQASLSIIGNEIGGKDHATVLHSVKTICNLMQVDREFRRLNSTIFFQYCIFDDVINYKKT